MTGSRFTRPSALSHRLVLEEPVFTADGGGGSSVSWQSIASFWAAIVPSAPSQDVTAERPGAQVRYRVTCRYRGDVKPRQRLRFGSRLLAIDGVIDPDTTKRWIEIHCREQQG